MGQYETYFFLLKRNVDKYKHDLHLAFSYNLVTLLYLNDVCHLPS